jgi:hypothetical protein
LPLPQFAHRQLPAGRSLQVREERPAKQGTAFEQLAPARAHVRQVLHQPRVLMTRAQRLAKGHL